MPLFPSTFIEDLKSQADIVQVVSERVPLRRAGAAYKGLCPFHGEKTPSFNVDPGRRSFKCFGCGVGGDVIKFIELYDKVPFQEAVKTLAGRLGIAVPQAEGSQQHAAAIRDREALLKAHEVAAAWFREQLATPAGAAARRLLAERAITPEMIERQGIGYAPASREALKNRLLKDGFSPALLVRSGLVVQRDEGTIIDRFRTRVMIPIHRENGAIIAFGGRAMEAGQQPKYLNSPETPIYTKGKTLYGLNLGKAAISRTKHAVMVEGYFDWAQAFQAGITNVVASSGTALTPAQARLLKRFASKVVLSFDPDAAGQGAAARTSELLVAEGFQVNVAMLPAGEDPDNFIRKAGGPAYQEQLRQSRPYLEYLLDRTAAEHDFTKDESRRAFLSTMLAVAARIPDAAQRDQFADRLAHKAQITEEVVRAEIRKAAVQKRTTVEERAIPVTSQIKPAEKGLIWGLVNAPGPTLETLAGLEDGDLAGLASEGILQQARSLQEVSPDAFLGTLAERLTSGEIRLIEDLGRAPGPPADPAGCLLALKIRRLDRERAEVQREISRLREEGGPGHEDEITVLSARKTELIRRIEQMELQPLRRGA